MTTNYKKASKYRRGISRLVPVFKPIFIIGVVIYFLCAFISLAQDDELQTDTSGDTEPNDAVASDEESFPTQDEQPQEPIVSEATVGGDATMSNESDFGEEETIEVGEAMGDAEVIEEGEMKNKNIFAKTHYNVAGSAQLDYLLVATDIEARDQTLDGFTTELSVKFTADVGEHFTAATKICYTCHGFEVGMAYMDLRASDKFIIRAGRFVPPFGDFPVRHDPANHRTSNKPLAYDMGRMLRMREWNMGVLPSPLVDNGVSILGTFDLADIGFFDYAVYAIGGLKASAYATDVDWLQSVSPTWYYVDNNSIPAAGGRLALGFFIGENSTLKFGLSGMYGTYDPDNDLNFLILGADLVFRYKDVTFRSEYLIRRTKMWLGDNPENNFKYGPGEDGYDPYFVKDALYGEMDFAATKWLEFVTRFDAMRRLGNVPIGSQFQKESLVLRYTGGINFVLPYAFRIKISAEYYDFSDFSDELATHLGLVGAF